MRAQNKQNNLEIALRSFLTNSYWPKNNFVISRTMRCKITKIMLLELKTIYFHRWSKQFLKRSDIDTTESTYPFFENFIEESKTIAKSPIEEVTKREQEWYPSSSEFLAPKLEVVVARQPSPPAGDFDNDEEAVDVDQVFVTHRICRSLPKNINRIKALSL